MNILEEVAKHIADSLIEEDEFDLRSDILDFDFWLRCDYKQRLSLACRETGFAAAVQNKIEKIIIEHLRNGDLPLYKQVFGAEYNIGVTLPGKWKDISYKNDVAPSFVLSLPREKYIKLWTGDQEHPGYTRYSFCECKGPGEGYEHIRVLLETNKPGSTQFILDNWQALDLLIDSERSD